MEKLPEEFKKKWLEALRSGEYTQGEHALYDKHFDRYCCLGVACKVAGLEPDSRGYIPRDWAHADKVPSVLVGDEPGTTAKTLARMNDAGKSFSEIADWIEQNL